MKRRVLATIGFGLAALVSLVTLSGCGEISCIDESAEDTSSSGWVVYKPVEFDNEMDYKQALMILKLDEVAKMYDYNCMAAPIKMKGADPDATMIVKRDLGTIYYYVYTYVDKEFKFIGESGDRGGYPEVFQAPDGRAYLSSADMVFELKYEDDELKVHLVNDGMPSGCNVVAWKDCAELSE